jgi:predicted peptidase
MTNMSPAKHEMIAFPAEGQHHDRRHSKRLRPSHKIGALILLASLLGAAGLYRTYYRAHHGFLGREYVDSAGQTFKYSLFVPHTSPDREGYPVILYLHGVAGMGDDGLRQTEVGLGSSIRQRESTFPILVVFPQARSRNWFSDSPDGQRAIAILEEVVKEYRVDPRRIYLVGATMGANGAWTLADAYPKRWAALVSVCGWGDPRVASRIKEIPCWFFHGAEDGYVRVKYSRDMVGALQAAGASPRYTEYPGIGHDCWTQAFETPELYAWLLQHRRDDL